MAASVRAVASAFALLLTLSSIATSACIARTPLTLAVEEGAPTTWGDFAATLDVPDCPSSNTTLTVNTTANQLDGGASITDPAQAGASLSFIEALVIASNRGTPHNIFFDAEVFPATQPGVIVFDETNQSQMPNAVLTSVCIDARQRGVVLQQEATYNDRLLPNLSSSLVVGLMFKPMINSLSLRISSQIAGCHVQGGSIHLFMSTLGPGNVLRGVSTEVVCCSFGVAGAPDSILRENYFGYDPLSRTMLSDAFNDRAIVAGEFATVSGNVFGAMRRVWATSSTGYDFPSPLVMNGNFVGVDEALEPVGSEALGLIIESSAAPITFGPDNVIRGVVNDALQISGTGAIQITRNSISGNGGGITYAGAPPAAAPVVTVVDRTHVEGTCSVAGRIEVFSDAGSQAETYLGETTCDGSSPWTLTTPISGGRNVTATLTDALGHTSELSVPYPVQ